MSQLGQKQTLKHLHPMSALPPKADIGTQQRDVRFVPKADIGTSHGTNRAYRDCHGSLFGGDHMAVDGHGHAMTIADYIALGTLIVLAIWAVAKLYL